MQQILDRKRRSEQMTKEEFSAFKKYVQSFPTKIDAAATIGVSRVTLNGLLFRGTGKPETIRLIREKISVAA